MVLTPEETIERQQNAKQDQYDLEPKALRIKLVDGTSGSNLTSTNGKLDVNASLDVSTLNKEVTQLEIKTLITTLNSLIETQQELIQRLAPLGAMRGPNDTLRVTGVSMPSTAVTGPITSAQSIAEKTVGGIDFTRRLAAENLTAIQGNINNTTGA